jgi:hypothetical protein
MGASRPILFFACFYGLQQLPIKRGTRKNFESVTKQHFQNFFLVCG